MRRFCLALAALVGAPLAFAEDLGAMVAMLCSAQASFVTGQSLVVDGGMGTSIF